MEKNIVIHFAPPESFTVELEVLSVTEGKPKFVYEDDIRGVGGGPEEERRPPQLRISVPQKNLAKFREVLLYILDRVASKRNVRETVLFKLLYFIDFDFYERYEEQLIGATYIKNKFGPTPREFKTVVERMIADNEVERRTTKYHGYPQTRYMAGREPDLSILGAHEIKLIDGVLNKLSDMNAVQISEYSHGDIPWVTTEDGDVIEYESVFYRTPLYSVRQYKEVN